MKTYLFDATLEGLIETESLARALAEIKNIAHRLDNFYIDDVVNIHIVDLEELAKMDDPR